MARYDELDDVDLDITRPRRRTEYAGFWRRSVAAFIDGLLLFVPYVVLQFGVRLAFDDLPMNRDPKPPTVLVLAGLVLVLYWYYFAVQESSPAQATVGKRVVGIVVTDLDGFPIGFGHATGRHVAKMVSNCTCGAGYLLAGVTERKQAFHDLLAGTLVLRRGPDPRGGR